MDVIDLRSDLRMPGERSGAGIPPAAPAGSAAAADLPETPPAGVDRDLDAGDVLSGLGARVIATPGRTNGSIAMYLAGIGLLFTGDIAAEHDGHVILGRSTVTATSPTARFAVPAASTPTSSASATTEHSADRGRLGSSASSLSLPPDRHGRCTRLMAELEHLAREHDVTNLRCRQPSPVRKHGVVRVEHSPRHQRRQVYRPTPVRDGAALTVSGRRAALVDRRAAPRDRGGAGTARTRRRWNRRWPR